MVLDYEHEKLLTLKEAQRLIPRNGVLSYQAIWRMIRQGGRARNGQLVFLESVKVGSRIYTTAEAFRRFLAAINEE